MFGRQCFVHVPIGSRRNGLEQQPNEWCRLTTEVYGVYATQTNVCVRHMHACAHRKHQTQHAVYHITI